MRDEHGTSPQYIYGLRSEERVIPELLGLVKGIICDGVVNDGELVALRQWMRSHPDALVQFPGNVLAPRLVAAFEDGIIDEDERAELRELLQATVGEDDSQEGDLDRSGLLPIDRPLPTVFFESKEFCFTGNFAYGTRTRCEAEVVARGGRVAKDVSSRTNYLVIGLTASPLWVSSTHGRKVEQAMYHRDELRQPVSIIPERHWVEALALDA